MTPLRTSVLLACLLGLLAACQGAPAGDPTADPESVIATAEQAAQLTRSAVTPTSLPTQVSATALAATQTATGTAAPVASGPTATASYNANVRSGPGVEYERIDDFYQGQTASLAGRHINDLGELWWYVRRIGGGWDGWVWDGAVTIAGDVSSVPFLERPATPQPTP